MFKALGVNVFIAAMLLTTGSAIAEQRNFYLPPPTSGLQIYTRCWPASVIVRLLSGFGFKRESLGLTSPSIEPTRPFVELWKSENEFIVTSRHAERGTCLLSIGELVRAN